MKIAVIGSGPLALYACAHFAQLGAHVVLFQKSPLGGNLRFCVSKDIKGYVDYPFRKSFADFWQEDLVPLIEFVEEKKIPKAGEVLRIHKRFLHRDEVVLNRSRLIDLFRIIYTTNPKDSILKQVEENPEIFKQLGDEVIHSLREPVESFEDFDIVIEATGRNKSNFKMGPSGTFALNENNLAKYGHFYYGKDFFTKCDLSKYKKLVMVGDDMAVFLALFKLDEWLFSHTDNLLIWINHNHIDLNNFELEKILSKASLDFETKKNNFENELRKWRDLDDFVKAKIPRPIEPFKKIEIYEGYNVTSVDKLFDREGAFVTIESPDFRSFVTKEINLKTISADAVIVLNGVDKNETLGVQLLSEEPGLYQLHSDSVKDGMLKILEIEQSVLQYFSKEDQ